MGNIPRFSGDNIGSVLKIQGLPVQAFSAFPAVIGFVINEADLQIRPGATWIDFPCSAQSMGYQQDGKPSANGDSYTQQVIGFLPGDEPEIEYELSLQREFLWILKVEMATGRRRLIGTPASPLELATRFDTGTSPEKAPGNALTWTGESLYRAPHLQ